MKTDAMRIARDIERACPQSSRSTFEVITPAKKNPFKDFINFLTRKEKREEKAAKAGEQTVYD